MIDFNAKKGFLCDMDGVIYHGNHILPGAAEFIHWLQDEHKEYLFLTNNSGMTPRELCQKLRRMGLDVPNAICCLDESETGAVGIINPMGAGYVRGQRDRVKTIARQDGDDHVRYAPKPEAMAASCSRIWEAVLLSAEAISSISCWAFCMFGLKSV